jgi:hypothetical protein
MTSTDSDDAGLSTGEEFLSLQAQRMVRSPIKDVCYRLGNKPGQTGGEKPIRCRFAFACAVFCLPV